ncbi:MAG: hypothetical protein QG635_1490 [Bacteroidota bacterium]|nr:hypothetical protein [Bacteroidota bacterium]
MTKVERNIHRMIKDFGFDKEWKEEGIQQEHERNSIEREKQNIEIAIKLLSRGLTIDDVADITGLTKSQIKKLKN